MDKFDDIEKGKRVLKNLKPQEQKELKKVVNKAMQEVIDFNTDNKTEKEKLLIKFDYSKDANQICVIIKDNNLFDNVYLTLVPINYEPWINFIKKEYDDNLKLDHLQIIDVTPIYK